MATEHTRQRVAENRATFETLIDAASRDIEHSRFRSASARLQSAARFAWFNHPGIYRSVRLEALAARIAGHLPTPRSSRAQLDGHVVHVVSQAYETGGHTRLVWRWIENDSTQVSSLVLTGQQGVPLPLRLQQAVATSGGRIVDLGEISSSLLVRSAELRSIAAVASTIVLHAHPYDVLPSISLHDVAANVVLVNHADHVFGLGVEVSDLVADIRPAGQQLSMAARGVQPARSMILPIPIGIPPQPHRRQARERLQIPDGATAIISIASAYKYGAAPGAHFIDIHRDFVHSHPDVVLIVVGPENTGRWQKISAETSGRFRAVGTTREIDAYYDAADIYLDSIPFASLTSLLDAAARGIPVLALNEDNPDTVLTSNDLSLVDKPIQFADRGDYLTELDALVGDASYRRRVADTTRASVARDHLSPGWNRHLGALSELLGASWLGEAATGNRDTGTRDEALSEALVEFQVAAGLDEPAWLAELRDAPYLPMAARARLLMAAPAGRRLASVKFMIPDKLRTKVKLVKGRLSRT